ncbi:MAG: hypothetical protein Q4B28_03840 [bacterium]|nr:hypothetical protein [bacterium]
MTSPFTPNNNRDESIKQLNATISTLQQKIANLTLNTHNDERKILQQQLKQTKLHLQITELERHIQEAQQAKQRILQMKDNILLAFNELTTCNAHHTTLGEYLNINDDNKLIGAKEIKTSCQDDNDSSS